LGPVLDYRTWSLARVTRHLLESTLVVVVVWLLTTLLQRSGAGVRYGLWLAASMKFFVPVSALVGLGAALGRIVPARVELGRTFASSAFDSVRFSNPVATMARGASLPTVAQVAPWVGFFAAAVWIIGSAIVIILRYRLWRSVRAALHASAPLTTLTYLEVPSGVELRSAPGVLEPGVIGWRQPVLLLPDGIDDWLKPEELQAVVAHERCHLRRWDNMTAALHMLTEIVFWFHPAVWVIGARLLAERERACDEAVLAEGHAPTTYARAIVNTCRLYVASPLACVVGVTGSKLTARIEGILRNLAPDPLRGWRKAVVVLTFAGLIVGPIGFGVGRAATPIQHTGAAAPGAIPSDPTADTPTFAAASVRLNTSGLEAGTDRILPGRYTATNLSLAVFIRLAYTPPNRARALEPFETAGGPDWLLSDRFDINATAGRDVSVADIRAMMRALLSERFQVRTHVEQRTGPVFRMSQVRSGRLGPQLRRSEMDCATGSVGRGPESVSGVDGRCGFFGPALTAPINSTRAYQAFRGLTMDEFAVLMSAYLGRPVVNSTGLAGYFDGDLEFTAEIMLPPPPSGPNPFDGSSLPSIFSVLPQQLGLRLEQTEGLRQVLVIDHAVHPTAN
jgi:uncharacterized protein (TIGR03435 family)